MAQDNSKETINLIAKNEIIRLSEVPDHLLDAWLIGIAHRSDYNYERDFIINIFNEIYEGGREMQGITPAEDDSQREEYRLHFERLLNEERQRRLSGGSVVEDVDIFELF